MRSVLFLWLFLISACSSFLCSNVTMASGQCSSDEQYLLLNLKISLIFNPSLSTKLVTWNKSVESWEGVTCDEGRVIGLDLSNEFITGGINSSSSLFSLQNLQNLNLAYNFLGYPEIPSEFAKLSNLVYLNLSNAGFGGQIPIAMSRLRRLVTLDMSSMFVPNVNSLKLRNPNLKMLVSNLRELRELHLDEVSISLQGSEWCQVLSSSVPKLQVLSMSGCKLTGPVNSCLLKLQSLYTINLSRNNLSTAVPEFFANFPNLTSLHLGLCGLYGKVPDRIFQSRRFQVLDLAYNSLLYGNLPEFPANGSMKTLALSVTNISGSIPDSIGNLQNLSRIELSGCNISGQIPKSVGNLPSLEYLDLSFNNLTGSLPSLSMCKNLKQITLSHNDLTGQINSTHWEFLTNLVDLNLRFNSLEGVIPASLFALPSIKKIQFAGNKFSGLLGVPPNISACHLETLELDDNRLEGPIPTALFGLQELKYLSLSSNKFSGSLHLYSVLQIGSLSHLDLSSNNLTVNAFVPTCGVISLPQLSQLFLASCRLRTFPRFLSYQTGLIYLDLSENQIQGVIPDWVWELTNLVHLNLSANFLEHMKAPLLMPPDLTTLDLHSNKLGGELPPLPPYLVYLDLSDNSFTSVIPEFLGNISIIFLSLSKNNFHGFIPESMCQESLSFQILDLSNNNLTGVIPGCLMKMSTEMDVPLKVLNLRNNSLTGHIPESFPGDCVLRTLDLSQNQLDGQVPDSLSNCKMMEVLDLGHNHISGTFPCQLKNLPRLRVLVLRSNNFSGPIRCPGSCGTWDKLQIFDLADNNFTGQLPKKCFSTWDAMKVNVDHNHLQFTFLELSGLYYQDTVRVTVKGESMELEKILMVFTSIDFSNNRLEGPIPDVLGDLKALYFLNLSHNALTGPISPSLQNLRQLESLDLSWNYLDGAIPSQLTDLNFLSFLNLSYNQLAGKIPEGTQFSTFTESSYEGNRGLCGTPLKNECTITEKPDSTERELKDEDGNVVRHWHFMVVGFAAGFAVIVTFLAFSEKGQGWIDVLAGKILVFMFPKLRF